MATPSPSRKIPYNFNPAQFRNAIRFVMEMGAPVEEDQKLTFHFEEINTFAGRGDGDRVPFNPAEQVVRVTKAPVSVPCDVQYVDAGDTDTRFGSVVPSKLKILLLDGDYEQVKDATYVIMGGDRYKRLLEQPAFGLFSVGVHTMVFQAEDEV